VFIEFDNEQLGKEAYEALKDNWQAYLVKGLAESPLLQKLGQTDH